MFVLVAQRVVLTETFHIVRTGQPGDVPAGAAVRLPLYRAGLLEWAEGRRGAAHHTRIHTRHQVL